MKKIKAGEGAYVGCAWKLYYSAKESNMYPVGYSPLYIDDSICNSRHDELKIKKSIKKRS